MRIAPSILQEEFIGLKAKVVKSQNPGYVRISGKVVNETRNTFTILHEGKEKVVVKDAAIFHFILPDGSIIEIDGKVLLGRPEDRVKRTVRRLW